jgi:SAM-dependent methyltransferase|tara:strand:+ start:28 stop:714 length:687 start_codon:yes stop_codon:yes gene_type:complete
MISYPKTVTEVFDGADFHIKYCVSFFKKYLKGDVLEVGAGCGSFTRHYFNKKITSILMTELDKKNNAILSRKFKNNKKVSIEKKKIFKIKKKFDVVLYLHVLEHIKNDNLEIKEAIKKLKKNAYLIFLVPAHNKMYSNLDKLVGHYRRYELNFFKKKFNTVHQCDLKFLDSMGYILYFLNKIFFKKEAHPSKLKIFIWDKFFTPITVIVDFFSRYRFGKCILAVYKKY